MSNLLNTYATALGVIPKERPILNDHFFPLKDEKYIVIHNDNKLQSKYYEYFSEVINLLRPVLHKHGYKIYQIGGPNDPRLETDSQYLGLSWNQSFHVIKNASLFLGIDSINSHVAAGYGIPSVVLFGHTYSAQVTTNWLPENKQIILEPEWGDRKPSYSPNENPKMIRTIKVEKIAQSVLRLLNIPILIDIKTVRIGNDYHEPIVEIIPDFFADDSNMKTGVVHLRMDLVFNEQCLAAWLSNNYKVNIVTNKPIDLNLLRQFKNNIQRITFVTSKSTDYELSYIKDVKSIGLNLLMIGLDESTISDTREKFFNYIVESFDHPDRSVIDKISKSSKFLTKKQILSQGKVYPSVSHWRAGKIFSAQNKIIDDKEFWQDIEYFYFYK